MKYFKKIEGVWIITLKNRLFKNGTAFTIPGLGIFVGENKVYDIGLIRHEFGHILQYKEKGFLFFWFIIVPISVWSALLSTVNKKHNHMQVWSEWSANRLSYIYFNQPSDWDFKRFPISA